MGARVGVPLGSRGAATFFFAGGASSPSSSSGASSLAANLLSLSLCHASWPYSKPAVELPCSRADSSSEAMPYERQGRGPPLPQPLPPFLPPLEPGQRPCWFHCCCRLARFAAHARAAAAAGVSGAALPFQSGRERATRSAPSSSCFTAASLRLRAAASGFFSSSCNSASCSSRSPEPRSSGTSACASSSSSASTSSRGGAMIVRPVQLMIWSSCFAEKYLAAPSRASANASASPCPASESAARNFFMLKTRKTRQLSRVAFVLFCSGINLSAFVTMPTSGSSSTIAGSACRCMTAAFVTGARVAPRLLESSSYKDGFSLTVSTRISVLKEAQTTISSWYSCCSLLTKASTMPLAPSRSMIPCSRGSSLGNTEHRDCCSTTRISKPLSTTLDLQGAPPSTISGHRLSFTTFAAIC
mmetsp:Transcript_16320/g.38302  ORF Transcript_16320/g.38302 Transcript_16320/m.38302 type:complete len:415 (+) Transcript_16320:111-1355(+)